MIDPRDLVGSKAGDPADILACMHDRYFTQPPGMGASDWGAPSRRIPNPPSVEGGPFGEIRLAATPAAAWAGQILRRTDSSEQPIWQVLKDVRRYRLHRIEAPGVRIMDRHSDSRMIGGPVALYKEGEGSEVPEEDRNLVTPGAVATSTSGLKDGRISIEWRVLDECFRSPIAAVALPDDSSHPAIRPDWPVVASIPRLHVLEDDGFLRVVYLSEQRMKLRDLLQLRDVTAKTVGPRFGYFLARRAVHDFFAPRRKRSLPESATLVAVLTSLTATIAAISRLVDLLF